MTAKPYRDPLIDLEELMPSDVYHSEDATIQISVSLGLLRRLSSEIEQQRKATAVFSEDNEKLYAKINRREVKCTKCGCEAKGTLHDLDETGWDWFTGFLNATQYWCPECCKLKEYKAEYSAAFRIR